MRNLRTVGLSEYGFFPHRKLFGPLFRRFAHTLHGFYTIALTLFQQLVAFGNIVCVGFVAFARYAAKLRFQPHLLFEFAAAGNLNHAPVFCLRGIEHIADGLSIGLAGF